MWSPRRFLFEKLFALFPYAFPKSTLLCALRLFKHLHPGPKLLHFILAVRLEAFYDVFD